MRFEYRNVTTAEGKKIRVAVAMQRPPGSSKYESVSARAALEEIRDDPTSDGMLLERTNGEEVVIKREDFEELIGKLR